MVTEHFEEVRAPQVKCVQLKVERSDPSRGRRYLWKMSKRCSCFTRSAASLTLLTGLFWLFLICTNKSCKINNWFFFSFKTRIYRANGDIYISTSPSSSFKTSFKASFSAASDSMKFNSLIRYFPPAKLTEGSAPRALRKCSFK